MADKIIIISFFCAEVLGKLIRNDKTTMGGEEYKIPQNADDAEK